MLVSFSSSDPHLFSFLSGARTPHQTDLDVLVLFSNPVMATGRQFDLPYLVEQWDDTDSHVEELIALIGDYSVARAAFDEAVKRRRGRIVTLRQKTRLLADSRKSMIVPAKELGGNMRKLFTAIATVMPFGRFARLESRSGDNERCGKPRTSDEEPPTH
jgi:hypothetical protein